MFNKMVDNSTMKVRNNCYVKVVCENYYCDDHGIIPKIHLVFNSKKDYDKLSDIEKMFKKYFKIEKKYINTEKKYFINYYLKAMIKQMEECEVMEVYSDHVEAFGMEFSYITDFIHNNNMILRLPQRTLIFYETHEEFIEEKLKNDQEYYKEKYGENGKYYRKILKVINLLYEKYNFK